jgi:hypothetical protein
MGRPGSRSLAEVTSIRRHADCTRMSTGSKSSTQKVRPDGQSCGRTIWPPPLASFAVCHHSRVLRHLSSCRVQCSSIDDMIAFAFPDPVGLPLLGGKAVRLGQSHEPGRVGGHGLRRKREGSLQMQDDGGRTAPARAGHRWREADGSVKGRFEGGRAVVDVHTRSDRDGRTGECGEK